MNPVVVRNVAIGEGIPKICVPIVGKTREEILDAAKKILPIEQMLQSGVQTGTKTFLILKKQKKQQNS